MTDLQRMRSTSGRASDVQTGEKEKMNAGVALGDVLGKCHQEGDVCALSENGNLQRTAFFG